MSMGFSYNNGGIWYSGYCYTNSTKSCNTDCVTLDIYDNSDNLIITVQGKNRWYNRPWQHFRYQSAIIHALQKWQDMLQNDIKQEFMQEYGYKRICSKNQRALLQQEMIKYPGYADLCNVKSTIKAIASDKDITTLYAR